VQKLEQLLGAPGAPGTTADGSEDAQATSIATQAFQVLTDLMVAAGSSR
jgi:hypothetical protein